MECEVYEQAIQFYESAILIQPKEPKWHMMIAYCYRKSANYRKSFDIYEAIHRKFPENLECKLIRLFNSRPSRASQNCIRASYASRK